MLCNKHGKRGKVVKILFLTPKLRKELKVPLGLLIRGSFKYTVKRLQKLVKDNNPAKLITVGDRVSQNIARNGINIDIMVVDNKVMRKSISPLELKVDKVYNVNNPAGTLTDDSWRAMEKAVLHHGSAKIIVDGEEDLLALFAVVSAPDSSMVVYGQPREGIVVVSVNARTKNMVQNIIRRMENKPAKN